MKYRFNYMEEYSVVSRTASDYVINSPKRPRWAVDWEWSYDFDEIFANIRLQVSLWLFRRCLLLLRWLGADVKRGVPEYAIAVKSVEVDCERIFDSVYQKLTEYQRRRMINGCMIVFGSNVLREVQDIESSFVFCQPVPVVEREVSRDGYRLVTHWFDVPVYFLPDFVGIAVIPDTTGRWCARIPSERGVAHEYFNQRSN